MFIKAIRRYSLSTIAFLANSEVSDEMKKVFSKCKEFSLATAILTKSGLTVIDKELKKCLRLGGKGSILIGTDLPSEPDAIRELMLLDKAYPKHLKLKYMKPGGNRIFHPKILITKDMAIIGSSNFTGGGLEKNHEANLIVRDPNVLKDIKRYFEWYFLGSNSRNITDEWLREYSKSYKKSERSFKQLKNWNDTVHYPKTRLTIKGHKFAFTGKIEDWPRVSRLYPKVRKVGGIINTHTAIGVDYLIQGDIIGKESTIKLEQANDNRIPIMDGDAFITLLERTH